MQVIENISLSLQWNNTMKIHYLLVLAQILSLIGIVTIMKIKCVNSNWYSFYLYLQQGYHNRNHLLGNLLSVKHYLISLRFSICTF